MNCRVEKSIISGKVVCPPNKSYTHRAAFLASLADGKSTIKNVLYSRDTNATIDACEKFGATIKKENGNLVITGTDQIDAAEINAENSGTTIRIATAIAALGSDKSVLSGDDSLKKRPMQPLLDALESIGATCSSTNGMPPVSVKGKADGGNVTIPGNISSQFISALLIMAPLTKNGLVLNIEGGLVSKPYLDATIAAMNEFGVVVKEHARYKKYEIPPQNYKATTFTIPSDFSSLALLLSAAVLVGKNLEIKIEIDSLPQGDKLILDILKKLGVKMIEDKESITINSVDRLEGGEFDLANTPDLLPAIAILSLKSKNPIHLYNVEHARYKETDRIAILSKELKKLGIVVDEKKDGLVLQAPDKLTAANLNPEKDHRLFMAFCIAGMYVGGCTVSDPESIDVSYPNFISEIKRIGGKISVS